MTTKPKAFAYLRVSGKGQVKGHGYDRQRDSIRAFAKRDGVEIVGEFRDAYTGTSDDRPGFSDMIGSMLDNGVRTVIVESLDRFARELMVQIGLLANLRTHGIRLLSASTGEDVTAGMAGDPIAEAMISMQGVFNQLEKRRLVNRLAKARAARRNQKGRCEGGRPFGTKPGERDTVARILSLRRKPPGRPPMSFAKIARRLNDEGVPTRRGKPWRASTVQAIAKRGRIKA